MRNKVCLFVFTLLVLYGNESWGNVMHTRTVEVAQQAKDKLVTGTVSDASEPIIGATVKVKGTTQGVITDMDGKFTLKVPIGATLAISYVGYQDKEIFNSLSPL